VGEPSGGDVDEEGEGFEEAVEEAYCWVG